jgi:hypothetical protein
MYVCLLCVCSAQTNKQTNKTYKKKKSISIIMDRSPLSLVVLPSPMKNVVISFSFALQVTKRGLQVTRLPHLLYLYGSKVPQGQAIR